MATILSIVLFLLTSSAAGTAVRVAPSVGSTRTTFTVTFTAPQASGRSGIFERSYSVVAAGRGGRGCTHYRATAVDNASEGARVHIKLRAAPPRALCRGRFRGQILETEGPHCVRPGPCPAFPTRVRAIATFRFRVR